jgi:hypothetical protein
MRDTVLCSDVKYVTNALLRGGVKVSLEVFAARGSSLACLPLIHVQEQFDV